MNKKVISYKGEVKLQIFNIAIRQILVMADIKMDVSTKY